MVEVATLKQFGVLSMFSDHQLECLAKVAEVKTIDLNSPVDEPCKPSEWLRVDDLTESSRYILADVFLGDSEVLSINTERLSELWDADPHVGHALMRQLALLYLELHATAHMQFHERLANS
jgi:hypothetical protein